MAFCKDLYVRLNKRETRKGRLDQFYFASYPIIRDFFLKRICIARPSPSDVKTAIVLVYSWMDRGRASIQERCFDNVGAALPLIQKARGETLSCPEIRTLGRAVGSSLIGTSKFLHMVSPERFAMWDTNVAWAGYRLRYSQMSKLSEHSSLYLEYLADIRELQLSKNLQRQITKLLPPNSSEIRRQEFALFSLGSQELAEQRKRPDAGGGLH